MMVVVYAAGDGRFFFLGSGMCEYSSLCNRNSNDNTVLITYLILFFDRLSSLSLPSLILMTILPGRRNIKPVNQFRGILFFALICFLLFSLFALCNSAAYSATDIFNHMESNCRILLGLSVIKVVLYRALITWHNFSPAQIETVCSLSANLTQTVDVTLRLFN